MSIFHCLSPSFLLHLHVHTYAIICVSKRRYIFVRSEREERVYEWSDIFFAFFVLVLKRESSSTSKEALEEEMHRWV